MSEIFRFSGAAMATRWQIRLCGDDEAEAARAADEAFARLAELENLLSRFVASSDVSHVNALRRGEKCRLRAETRDCLAVAQRIARETGRAFDPTAGTLVDFWKSRARERAACAGGFCEEMPAWREAFENFRFGTLALREDGEIECVEPGAKLDLGGVGKGFALDALAETLRLWGFSRALLAAGGSTILALNAPEGAEGWKIGLGDARAGETLALANAALSSSGTQFQPAHLVDPRTGLLAAPRRGNVRVVAPTAAEADALSTAFCVMSDAERAAFLAAHPEIASK